MATVSHSFLKHRGSIKSLISATWWFTGQVPLKWNWCQLVVPHWVPQSEINLSLPSPSSSCRGVSHLRLLYPLAGWSNCHIFSSCFDSHVGQAVHCIPRIFCSAKYLLVRYLTAYVYRLAQIHHLVECVSKYAREEFDQMLKDTAAIFTRQMTPNKKTMIKINLCARVA